MKTYVKIRSKEVFDEDGFLTEYTWYAVVEDVDVVKYVFVFGDSDIYYPEDENYDWECETYGCAEEWFEGYESDYEEMLAW